MNGKVEQSAVANTGSGAADTIKLILALLILVAGIIGFYWFANDYAPAVRGVGLVLVMLLAVAVAAFTAKGRALMQFMSDSNVEVRKVVWPTRQETIQTTLVILVVVVILGIMLWVIDLILASLIRWLV